ncbi:MAG: DegT/DnrJ/EryC1/StrS family aminotransferase, partial [Betaproteobacteria bacterium]|nr:DegT/DnrJ/EryC1/StrS family aminotransferase [Betaproteobacteria bacterium]
PEYLNNPNEGAWYYEQQELGFNYRITDLQAALGLSQLQRLDEFLAARHSIASRYQTDLSELPITLPHIAADRQSAWHLFPIQIDASRRRSIFDALRNQGIGVQVHYHPVHLQPYYRQFGFRPGDYPCAEAYYQRAFSLPMYAALTPPEQQKVIRALSKLLT